jgi:hypothetical protein
VRRRFDRRRPPILEVIAAWDEGPPPALPDEGPDDGRTIRWGAGALDGVVTRDGDGAREGARGAALAALIEHAATGDAEAAGALYEAARGDGIVFALDAAMDALARARVHQALVADLGRRMLREAHHREPLKLAVALVGRAGDRDDIPLLETLARHDEFSVVAGSALANLLEDPVQAWWRVACLARGWGKVEAVARLAAVDELPEDVRGWMLRHGCDNDVMPEYLAFACATAGGLEDALAGLVDDELLDGASTIVRALVNGGPAEDIADYEPGPRVAAVVVELVAERPPSIARLAAVVDIRRWAEDFEEHVAIAERCGRVLHRAEGRAFVTERLGRPGEALEVWPIAEAMGLDPWEACWRHLQDAPEDSRLYHRLARTPVAARWARLAAFAEAELPLTALASGPEERLFPADGLREPALSLAAMVQDMRPGRWSGPLLAAALLSPVISTRNAALHALGASSPLEWGSAVRSALRRLAIEEPTADVRVRAREQLGRTSTAAG